MLYPPDLTVNLLVTDEKGCEDEDEMIIHFQPNSNLQVFVKADDEQICLGSSCQLTATASGGTQSYTYNWSPITGLDDPTSATPIATPAETTEYTVTVFDVNNSVSGSITIVVEQMPSITSTAFLSVWFRIRVKLRTPGRYSRHNFEWESQNNTSGCVTGNTAVGNGSINDLLITTCSTIEFITYTISPTGPAPTYCPGEAFNLIIEVNLWHI